MIKIETTGDFNKTMDFLKRAENLSIEGILNKYGQMGVNALMAATPKNTGHTASKWGYKVSSGKNGATITWTNDHIVDGIPIVVLLQYGHGTRTGGYVSGVDFINPAIKGVMEGLAEAAWTEVTK